MKTFNDIGVDNKIRVLLPNPRNNSLPGIFCYSEYRSYKCIYKGPDTVSEVVLDILPSGRDGNNGCFERIRGLRIYKCDHGRMDQRRKYMDVPGAFAHEEKRKTCIGPMKKG